MNCNLPQQSEQEFWKCTRERGRGKELILAGTISKQALERQEGGQQVGDKPLSEAGKVVDHSTHLLSQWAAPEPKLKNKQQTLKTHWQQRGLIEHWTFSREKEWAKS
jgi:hypothetical protein